MSLISTSVLASMGRIGGWPQNQRMKDGVEAFNNYVRSGKVTPMKTYVAPTPTNSAPPPGPSGGSPAPSGGGGKCAEYEPPREGVNGEQAVGWDFDCLEVYEDNSGLYGYSEDGGDYGVEEGDVIEWFN